MNLNPRPRSWLAIASGAYCPSSSRRNSSTASFACFANRSASLTGSLSAMSTREINNFPICLQSAETSSRYLRSRRASCCPYGTDVTYGVALLRRRMVLMSWALLAVSNS